MLYLLRRVPFEFGYNEYDSKVVRGHTEGEARKLANVSTGGEGKIWEDVLKVMCTPIELCGNSEVILSSFNAG